MRFLLGSKMHVYTLMQVLNAVDFRMSGLVGRYGGTFFPSGLRRAEYTGGLTVLCVCTRYVLTVCTGVSCVRLLFTRLRCGADFYTTSRHVQYIVVRTTRGTVVAGLATTTTASPATTWAMINGVV